VQVLIDSFDRMEEVECLFKKNGVWFRRTTCLNVLTIRPTQATIVVDALTAANIEWQWTWDLEEE
jgi:hypothetical protein